MKKGKNRHSASLYTHFSLSKSFKMEFKKLYSKPLFINLLNDRKKHYMDDKIVWMCWQYCLAMLTLGTYWDNKFAEKILENINLCTETFMKGNLAILNVMHTGFR